MLSTAFQPFKQVTTNRLKIAPLDSLVLTVAKGLEASIALAYTWATSDFL